MGCHPKASTLRTTGRIETVIVSTTRKLPPPTMDYTQDAKIYYYYAVLERIPREG